MSEKENHTGRNSHKDECNTPRNGSSRPDEGTGRSDDTRPPHETGASDESSTTSVGRRKFLKAGVATAALTVGASQPGMAATYTVDPSEGSEIDGPLMDAVQKASNGDIIEVTSGTYTVDSISNNGKAISIVGGDVVLKTSGGGTIVNLHGDNWTFDGFGFDYQNTSNPPSVDLGGDGWEFANTVFWNTKLPSSSTNSKGAVLYPNVPGGATGTIRNCYLHDGAVDPDGYADYKAMWAGGDNIEGTLVMDGMWCEAWAENTLYVSNNSGRIEVYNSYFRNTNVSGPRITDSAHVENCTFVLDGKPPNQYRNGQQGSRSVRGVWWNAEKGYYGGNVTIRGCDFVWNPSDSSWANNPVDASDGSGGALVIEDTNFHNTTGASTIQNEGHDLQTSNNTHGSADSTPPIPAPPSYGSTPTSGSGSDGSGGGGGHDSSLTVDSLSLSEVETNDTDATFDAAWEVSDDSSNLESVDLALTDADDGDTEETTSVGVSGGTASGTTRLVATGEGGSGHTYRAELTVNNSNGDSLSDTATASEEPSIDEVWNENSENEMVFQSTREAISNYDMRVFGSVKPGKNANLDDGTDSLSNPSGNEYVVEALVGGGGWDNWLVSGSVDSLSVEAGIDITVNGVRFTAKEIEGVGSPSDDTGDDTGVWKDGEYNRVALSGGGSTDRHYEIVVSGDVDVGPKANVAGGSDKLIQTGESEYTIRGLLQGGTDNWDIDGKVTSTTFDDNISMTVNGTEYPTADLEGTGTAPDRSTSLPNTLIIDGTDGEASYQFTVSGDVVFSIADGASVNRGDAIDGSTAQGSVSGGKDAYAFSGDIMDLMLDGEALLTIDDST